MHAAYKAYDADTLLLACGYVTVTVPSNAFPCINFHRKSVQANLAGIVTCN